jgi:caspase domain-containing protein
MAKTATGLCIAFIVLALVASLSGPAQAQKRIALLIGNIAYEHVPRLATAASDARTLGETLKGLGFTVVVAENQSRQDMSRALLAFDKAIEPGDTVFFFFAGHGFEIHGQNYLLPTDVPAVQDGEDELLRDAAVPAERIIDRLQARGARIAILVLDACRDNPFERSGARALRGAGGLAPMTPAEGVFVVFSAGAKQTALDRLGRNDPVPNSVFTRNFARELVTPGLTLVQVAKRTQTKVKTMAASVGHDQTPAYYDQVVGDVMINRSGDAPAAAPAPQVAALPGAQLGPRDDAVTAPPANRLIADLDALAAARNWPELHDHLADVSPTLRDAHWNRLVEQAALGELEPLTAPGGSAVERLATIERYYPRFPSLAGSPQFLALRATVGLDAFGRCFDETGGARQCRDDLERFVHGSPASAELARGAAHLVGVKFNRQAASLFYVTGLDAPGGEAVCTDSELNYDLIVALQLPPDYREAKAARTIAERCWDAVKTAVVANVARETAASYYLQNVCPNLIRHNAVTGLREKRCQAVANP